MVSRNCAVTGCTFTHRENDNVVSYFPFPTKENLRKSWLTLCGLDDKLDVAAVEKLRVCSRHFDDSDFERDLRSELLGTPCRSPKLKSESFPNFNLIKIKEEPIDAEELCDQTSLSDAIVKIAAVEAVDVKWWKELDSCELSAANQQESNNLVGLSNLSHLLPVEQIETAVVQDTAVQVSSSGPTIQHPPSSLPAIQTWPGEYGFTVSFGPQEKTTKGIAWTYSKIKDKLYVGKDTPCPINFSTNTVLPSDVTIRVMALYTSPEQVSEVVKRCVNHSMKELTEGIPEAEHLVRCESAMAKYHEDVSTRRHSVIVPFENPQVGQQYSTYIYKFTCFGSCAGGPNRRPLMLIFTLEKDNIVIGRKKLDVKICACPGRDRKTEETQQFESENSHHGSLKRKEPPSEFVSLPNSMSFIKSVFYPPAKKSKNLPDKDGYYSLKTNDKACYEFLLQTKKFYEICKTMENLPPDMQKALLNYNKKKSDDE